MIARFHAQAIQALDGCELFGVYGVIEESVKAVAKEYNTRGFLDFDEFLAEPDLDIVTIGTPSGSHLEPCLKAAAAGKHVIVEKPLEITTERIDQMIAACDKAGVI